MPEFKTVSNTCMSNQLDCIQEKNKICYFVVNMMLSQRFKMKSDLRTVYKKKCNIKNFFIF